MVALSVAGRKGLGGLAACSVCREGMRAVISVTAHDWRNENDLDRLSRLQARTDKDGQETVLGPRKFYLEKRRL